MSDIEWVDEPPPTGNNPKGKHRAIAQALRANPGQWGLIARDVSAGNISQMRRATAYTPRNDFEITARRSPGAKDSRHVDVYARYIGGAS